MRKLMVDAAEVERLRAALTELRRWRSTHAPRLEALQGLLETAQVAAHAGWEAASTLASERAANAVLTAETERLQATLTRQQASYAQEIALNVAAERERCAGVAEHATQRRRQIVAALNGCAAERCAVAEAIRR